MLTQKPGFTEPPVEPCHGDAAAAQAVIEALRGSPEFGHLDQFFTSPLDASPFMDDDILNTPAMDSNLAVSPDILTSPIFDFPGQASFDDLPLFGDATLPLFAEATSTAPKIPRGMSEMCGLPMMPSPPTPALDPSSLTASPALGSGVTLPSAVSEVLPSTPATSIRAPTRRKAVLTGTRKGVTPGALIPEDAPIQTRNYTTPSTTSRKEIPAVIIKKRTRAQAFDDDPLLLRDRKPDLTAPPNESEQDAIEAKRRQNTLAARRSRKRKLEYQNALELSVEHWKARALLLEGLLQEKGVDVPSASPPPQLPAL